MVITSTKSCAVNFLFMDFKERFEACLEENELTKTALCNELGIENEQNITHWLRRGGVSKKWLIPVCKRFGVNPAWLLTGEEPKYPGQTSSADTIVDYSMGSGSMTAAMQAFAHINSCSKQAQQLIERIIVAETSQTSSPQLIDALTKVLDIVVPAASSKDYQALMEEISGKDT